MPTGELYSFGVTTKKALFYYHFDREAMHFLTILKNIGVSIGRSVYIHIELTDYLFWKQADDPFFLLLGKGQQEAHPLQLNKRVTAAPQEQSRD